MSEAPPTQRTRRPSKTRASTAVLGGPTEPDAAETAGRASLVLIHPPDADIGRRLELDRAAVRVGRDLTCDLALDRTAVSRFHAEVVVDDEHGGWRVRDLASTNGTFVNERPVGEATLRDGDQVRFGDVVFKYLSRSSIEHTLHEELYQLSVLDGLTGVHNRRFFVDALERELASAQRHGHPITLVLFDVDHFKRINDVHGHLAGDAVLRELAARLRPRMRREDLLARYGGEEFVAILSVTAQAGGVRFADAVRAIVARSPFEVEGRALAVTVSAGVATSKDEPEMTAVALIRRADALLYEAKRTGRDRTIGGGPAERDPDGA